MDIELQYITHKNKSFIKRYAKIAKTLLREYYYRFLNEKETEEVTRFIKFEVLKEEIKNNEFNYYLILNNKKEIGILRTRKEENTLSITRLHFSKKLRRQGFGTKVINILKENMEKDGIEKLKFPVITNDTKTKAIMKKWDFEPSKTIARYLGSEIYLYEKLFFYTNQNKQ